jgi:hypothetical protein
MIPREIFKKSHSHFPHAFFPRFIRLQFNPFRVKLAAFTDFAFSVASIGRIISEGAGFNVNA